MPVNAKFIADFTTFEAAVAKADVQLRGFGASAATVEKSLNRMADGFSGRRLIEDATKAAEAIDRIGGTSKLTEKELAAVAAQAAEASEKMRLMGIDVPARLEALAAVAPKATGAMGSIESAALSAGKALAAAFTLEKVGEFVAGLGAGGREIRNLSQETGIATQTIQVFGAVLSDLGVSNEQLARSIASMANRVAGGDASATAALHRLGLSFEAVRNQKPDELFQTLLRGVDQLPDQFTKVTVASDLFGDRLGAAVVKVAHGFDHAVAEARKNTQIMTDESIKQAAAFDDAWSKLVTNSKAAATNLFAPLLKGAADWLESIAKAQSKLEAIQAMLGGSAWKKGFEDAAKALQAPPLAVSHDAGLKMAISHGAGTPPAAQTSDAVMAALRADVLKPLTDDQQRFLEQLYDIGQATTENARLFGVSAAQLELFRAKEEQIIQTQANLADQLREGTKLYAQLELAGGKATDELNAKTAAWLEQTERAIQRLREVGQAAATALADRGLPQAQPTGFDQALERRNKALETISEDERSAAGRRLMANGEDPFSARRAQVMAEFDDAIAKLSASTTTLSEAQLGAVSKTSGLADAFAAFTQRIDGMVPKVNLATGENTVGTDPRVLAYLSQGYTQGEAMALVGGYGSSIGAPKHRALGGPVMTGQSYLVGERGPELFTAGASGAITPNEWGGGGSPTINVTISGIVERTLFAQEVKKAVLAAAASASKLRASA